MELKIWDMNRLYRYILAATAIVAAASCTENLSPETEPSSDNLVQMTFTTTVDEAPVSKTTYKSRNVYWEAADRITVFSVGDETVATEFGVKELAADKTSATFKGLADAQATSFYAVYPHNAENAYADGTLTVDIPSEQTAVADGFASGANVSVAYTENNEEASLQFRNVTTLLCIKFTDEADAENTRSITFKAKKNETEYWGLSGKASVTLDAETKLPVAGEGDVQYVTLEAPDGGFVKDVVYCIPAYPVGVCTGFEVAFTALDGGTSIKTKNASGTLQRNWLFNFGSIPNPYPETFTVTLDFTTDWPFNEDCVAAEEQSIYESSAIDENSIATYLGESYTYTCSYDYRGTHVNRTLEFKISKGRNDLDADNNPCYYSYSDSSLKFTNMEKDNMAGAVQLPGIEGLYLTNVSVVKKGNSGRITLVNPNNGNTHSAFYQGTGANRTYTFTLYADKLVSAAGANGNSYTGIKATAGRSFEVRFRDANMTISKITLTYSSVKPGNAPTE